MLIVGAPGIGRTTTSRCEHSADTTRDKKEDRQERQENQMMLPEATLLVLGA